MNKTLKGKVTRLENNVLQKQELGTTKICTCGFPEPEQTLLEQARKLSEMNLSYDDATAQQLTIIEKAGKTLNFRIFDLFTMYLEGLLCQGDPIAKVVLHERFLWFIQQLREELRQQLEVSEIERNTPEDCEVDVVDEYFRKSPDVFTEKSYAELSTEITLQCMKAGREPESE